MKDVLIMGIESSCDETSVAIVKNGREVLSNVINSQIKIHEEYGGVVPEIASRCHTEVINKIIKVTLDDIDAIAVTHGPGLVGALLVGVSYAKGLSYVTGKPLIPVNHIEGHIAGNYLTHNDLKPPFLCLIISGGHTHLVKVTDYNDFEILGKTRDDAVGEAFDKVARVMGLPYPGGPQIDKLAKEGNNFFGIKASKSWLEKGLPYSLHNDDKPSEKFCNFSSAEESMEYHSRLLMGERYQKCHKYDSTDHHNWLKGIKAAGYATNIHYVRCCERIISRYKLFLFDHLAEKM